MSYPVTHAKQHCLMCFLGMLTDWTVIFCRPRLCLFKGFYRWHKSSCRYSRQKRVLLVDADASTAMTFRTSVTSDSSCSWCFTSHTCFVSRGFVGIVQCLTKTLNISENFFICCCAGVSLCILLSGPISLGWTLNFYHSLDVFSQHSICKQGKGTLEGTAEQIDIWSGI